MILSRMYPMYSIVRFNSKCVRVNKSVTLVTVTVCFPSFLDTPLPSPALSINLVYRISKRYF